MESFKINGSSLIFGLVLNVMTFICAKLVGVAHANHFIESFLNIFLCFSCSLFEHL